MLQPVQQKQ